MDTSSTEVNRFTMSNIMLQENLSGLHLLLGFQLNGGKLLEEFGLS